MYAIHDKTFFLKLVGDVRLSNAFALYAFSFDKFMPEAPQHTVVDFSTTEGVDSTTLGLLAQFANEAIAVTHEKPLALCPHEGIRQLLLNMCFQSIFVIPSATASPPENFLELPNTPIDEIEMCQRALAAHQTLSQLSEENKLEFQDVIIALTKDLKDHSAS